MDKAKSAELIFGTFVFFFVIKLGSSSHKGYSNREVYLPLQHHSYRAHFKV